MLMLVLWGLGRRPGKTLMSSTDAASVAAINRAQLGLVQVPASGMDPEMHPEKHPAAADESRNDSTFRPPLSIAERIALARQLREAMDQGDPFRRLEAVRRAGEWGHVSVLPLLRRGLRDADSLVVEAAAAAMERHRGATRPSPVQMARPPRNVARMR